MIDLERYQSWLTEALVSPEPALFYSSFDIRDAGFKVVPVDANCFPSGWNNLGAASLRELPVHMKERLQSLESKKAPIRRVLVVSENHTLNTFYFENLRIFCLILKDAGFDVRAGVWNHPTWKTDTQITTSKNEILKLFQIQIQHRTVTCSEWQPDVVIFNNDCSIHPGPLWDDVSVPVIPPIEMGWYRRKKIWFFDLWNKMALSLSKAVDVEPWIFQVLSRQVESVDFKAGQGLEEVADTTRDLLEEIRLHYHAHKINEKPAVFVKHSSGTYGMGVMTIYDSSEIAEANRKTKNKMSIGKGKRSVDQVIIQEAIPSKKITGKSDEAVMYALGHQCVGGFLRINERKNEWENLNSLGMIFDSIDKVQKSEKELYSLVARTGTIILGREFQKHGKTTENI